MPVLATMVVEYVADTAGLGTVVPAFATIGVALVGAGIAAVKMAADYQESMNKVQALTGASTDQMTAYDASLKQLAMNAGVAPEKLSEGLYNVVSAGYQGKDAMTMLTLATEDAKIGMTDAGTTTKSLAALLAQFGLKAKDATRVNGEMLETVTLGSGTFADYAGSIVKAASSASQFHISMETMNAAYATLTSSQLTAKQSSTDLQASFKLMESNIGTVSNSLHSNGIAFDQTKFNAMDYGHQIVYLNNALQEAGEKHVKVTGMTLQAAQAISTIAGHIGVYNKDLATLSDKQAMAEKTQQAWAVTQQGFNVSMERLKATASVVMIDLGQKLLPIATAGVNLLSNAIQNIGPVVSAVGTYFSKFDLTPITYAWKQFTNAVNELLAPLRSGGDMMGKLSPHLTDLRNLFSQLLVSGIKDIAGFITNLANGCKDLGPPLQTVGNLLKGELSKEFKTLGEDAKQVGTWFQNSVVPAIKQAEPGFKALGNTMLTTVVPAILQVRGVFVDVIQHAFEKFAPIIEKIVPPLIKFAGILANDVANGLKFIMPYILQAAQAIGKFADEIMDRVAPIAKKWIEDLTPLVKSFAAWWNANWPNMQSILEGVWNVIVGVVKIAWAIVSGVIKIGLDLISGNWGQAWTDMKDMLGGIWDGIKNVLSGAWGIIKGLFGIWVTDAKNAGGNIVKGIADGIKAAVHWVTDAVGWIGQQISNFLPHSPAKVGPLMGLEQSGTEISNQISKGMLNGVPLINSAMGNMTKPISLGLKGSATTSTPLQGGGTQDNSVHIYLDGKEMTTQVMKRAVKELRREGLHK